MRILRDTALAIVLAVVATAGPAICSYAAEIERAGNARRKPASPAGDARLKRALPAAARRTFRTTTAADRFAEILRHVDSSAAPELIGTRAQRPPQAGVAGRWSALVAQHREAVESCTTHDAFAAAIRRLIHDAGISHFHYFTDAEWKFWHLKSAFGPHADQHTVEHIGVIPQKIGGRYFVRGVLEGSPASNVDVRVGDELVSVDGFPYSPVRSFEGMEGTPVELKLRRRPALVVNATVTPVKESLFAAMQRAIIESITTFDEAGFRFAYIHAWTLLGDGREYDELTQLQNSVDGLVLDFRDGVGGRWGDAERFLLGNVDELAAVSTPPRWTKPVVLLTADGTRSAKEIVAHKVQQTRRAPLVGEPTPGHVIAVGRIEDIGDDAILLLPGQRFPLEGRPTQPDYPVSRELRYAAGADPQFEFARKLLARLASEQSAVGEPTAGPEKEIATE